MEHYTNHYGMDAQGVQTILENPLVWVAVLTIAAYWIVTLKSTRDEKN